jgi:hypothetical protein
MSVVNETLKIPNFIDLTEIIAHPYHKGCSKIKEFKQRKSFLFAKFKIVFMLK